ncbi:MAG: cobalamin 5''-phosphate synthase/cobalamin synthase [Candidatus Saganbacteria bacterium]|uniref:Adenosylcobinamide-GDP ribazoletransferase n=1 Tax=Candidatus Saganbacteria bacterium TaxID=2575572 RepID=A0A833L238_UNCSA|nr:MAG: cobalamin 5''-phosphate synthase/cobalamin synthase [Candidatus Saganbacteria bacterium]
MKNLLTAIQFLTRIPVPGQVGNGKMSRSMPYFPAVGLLIGGILVIINLTLSPFFPRLLVDVLLLITLILVTGAFHLDGFADTIDGFYAGRSKEEALKIMRDARIGAMAVIGLICLLGLKLALLYEIPEMFKSISLLVMPVIGRWMMALSGAVSAYARSSGGLGEAFTNRVGLKDFIYASFLPVVLILGLLQIRGIILIFLAVIFTLCLTAYIKKKIGGMTGDTLGAVNEIVEVMVLLSILMMAGFNL